MEYSPQQISALDAVRRWLDAPPHSVPQVFRLEGYAGTGKTTLAQEISAHLGGRALAAAFTGKAASVMARKGLPGATTLHRLIYTPTGGDRSHLVALKEELEALQRVTSPDRTVLHRLEAVERAVKEAEAQAAQPRFLLKEESDVSYAPLVILDEHSMVNERMGEDLLSFGTRVLALGDPAQLPPVKGTGYFTRGDPDVLLTEVHRQAADSPIIRLATIVREGRALPYGEWGAARVVDRVSAAEAQAADQILCGTNAKRRAINRRHRELAGHLSSGPMPRAGEKLVCLKNDHEMGLLNGTLWYADEDADWAGPGEPDVYLRVTPEEGGEPLGVTAEASLFLDEDLKPQWGRAQQFTYGSCLTVHKSQGSQWDNVICFDDWPRRSDSYRQWLYTGITRAAERVTVVRS